MCNFGVYIKSHVRLCRLRMQSKNVHITFLPQETRISAYERYASLCYIAMLHSFH